MASDLDYAVVTKALAAAITSDESKVPAMWRGMIPANIAPDLAKELGKIAVDTLDAARLKRQQSL